MCQSPRLQLHVLFLNSNFFSKYHSWFFFAFLIQVYAQTLPASWEIWMQVKKQQLELDMEQTDSKLEKIGV